MNRIQEIVETIAMPLLLATSEIGEPDPDRPC
jgi:hypothetical protein